MLSMPPWGVVATPKTVVEAVVKPCAWCLAMSAANSEFGLFNNAWVMPAGRGSLRNGRGVVARLSSGKATVAAGLPIVNGTTLTGGITGAPLVWTTVPSAKSALPCGIEANLLTEAGAVNWVAGKLIQSPGSKVQRAAALGRREVGVANSLEVADSGEENIRLSRAPIGHSSRDQREVQCLVGQVQHQEVVARRFARGIEMWPPDYVKTVPSPVAYQFTKWVLWLQWWGEGTEPDRVNEVRVLLSVGHPGPFSRGND